MNVASGLLKPSDPLVIPHINHKILQPDTRLAARAKLAKDFKSLIVKNKPN